MKKEPFGELVIDNQDSWYRIAKSYLRDDADCADAIQSAIVQAFDSLHTLRNDQYAKTWFVRILINECHKIIRKNQKVVSLDGYQEEGRVSEAIDGFGQYSDLYESIMQLKEQERTSILLYYFEGYSIKEIAQCMDSTESAIKKRLVRGREHLRTLIKENVRYGY